MAVSMAALMEHTTAVDLESQLAEWTAEMTVGSMVASKAYSMVEMKVV